MEPISGKYRERIMRMMAVSRGQDLVSDKNVFQAANAEILPFVDSMIEENLLPGSCINGMEKLEELLAAARAGEPCLLLLEHYSNFDLPVFHYLLRKSGPKGQAAADALLAIAGIKLNESNPVVLAFTEAYTRLVIYPSRSLEIIKANLKEPKELVAEIMRSTTVNHAAMKSLAELKKGGKLVLVFPSGTRYRPWDPSTKRGVREIDSYLKSFSKMALVAINGNILRLNTEGNMEDDLICQDRVVYTVSPIIDCAAFREEVKSNYRLRDEIKSGHPFREDKKQAIVDEVMAQLDRIHEAAEKDRLQS
jgi:1-acyl-sn-glycerol-3-phosphate acyltransferase